MRAYFLNIFLSIFILLISSRIVSAACDCNSTDGTSPCTGNSLSVTVNAKPINGPNSIDATFNWSFNSGGVAANCGQFANGDYWLAPAEGQKTVTITSITGSGPISADADPIMESMGLLSGVKNYGNHNPAENIIPQLPISYVSTTSLVAAIQRNETLEGNCGTPGITGECVDAYHVVTILPLIPPDAGANLLRPNITGTNKATLSFSSFDFNRLPSESYLKGTDSAGFESIRQRWSHSTEIFSLGNKSGNTYSEGGRAFRSHLMIDDYAAGVARQWNDDMMTLFSDDNNLIERRAALAAMLTYGHDIHSAIFKGEFVRHWGTGAGQHLGKAMPAIFLAALSRNTSFKEDLKTASAHAHDKPFSGPQEFAQIHQGPNGPIWGDRSSFRGQYYLGAYWNDLLASQCYDGANGNCNPSFGAKTQVDPHGYIDGPPNLPGSNYVGVSLGPMRSFAAMMLLMPEICNIADYDLLIDYVDRITNNGIQTANDPCVTPDSREDPKTCDAYRNQNCMYYGKTWGPINPSDETSACITTPTPPYNKIGRFTSRNGTKLNAGYASYQVENNWLDIRGDTPSCLRSADN